MRGRALRGLIALAAAAAAAAVILARAQAPGGVEVTLEAPHALVAGDRAEVVAVVRIEPANDLPLLVTPRSEGAAVEVVRGRLLRADAEDPTAVPLRFRLPIVARGAGTSVFRVRVSGWACDRRCAQVTGDASAVLRVERERD
jgi:hypothetical protein